MLSYYEVGKKQWKQCLPHAKPLHRLEGMKSLASSAPQGPSPSHCFRLPCLYLYCRSSLWHMLHRDRLLSLCNFRSVSYKILDCRNNVLSCFQGDSKARCQMKSNRQTDSQKEENKCQLTTRPKKNFYKWKVNKAIRKKKFNCLKFVFPLSH